MLFSRSLHEIYYSIFELVKLGFSAEYIESISPAEMGIFKSYIKMEHNNKYNDQNREAAEAVGLDLGDL